MLDAHFNHSFALKKKNVCSSIQRKDVYIENTSAVTFICAEKFHNAVRMFSILSQEEFFVRMQHVNVNISFPTEKVQHEDSQKKKKLRSSPLYDNQYSSSDV
jgi:hypothetical protein